jgi:outer membrane lipoprotein-sorting protein
LATVGGIGFVVLSKNKDTTSVGESATQKAVDVAAKAECAKLNDKDLCKFYSGWKMSKQYRMISSDPGGDEMTFEADRDKSRIIVSGKSTYEIITVGDATYTKAGDVWYKQLSNRPNHSVSSDEYKVEFDEPVDDVEQAKNEFKTAYKRLGKEACGNLQCFKYELIDPENTDTQQFIWFDDKDYQLRRARTVTPDGTSNQTFEYDNVSIKVPAPVKELAPDQMIMPGSNEPMTVPSADSLR